MKPTTQQPNPHTPEARIEALELLLQALVLVLECEPRFTSAKLQAWLELATQRMQATGSASPVTLAALARLRGEVLE